MRMGRLGIGWGSGTASAAALLVALGGLAGCGANLQSQVIGQTVAVEWSTSEVCVDIEAAERVASAQIARPTLVATDGVTPDGLRIAEQLRTEQDQRIDALVQLLELPPACTAQTLRALAEAQDTSQDPCAVALLQRVAQPGGLATTSGLRLPASRLDPTRRAVAAAAEQLLAGGARLDLSRTLFVTMVRTLDQVSLVIDDLLDGLGAIGSLSRTTILPRFEDAVASVLVAGMERLLIARPQASAAVLRPAQVMGGTAFATHACRALDRDALGSRLSRRFAQRAILAQAPAATQAHFAALLQPPPNGAAAGCGFGFSRTCRDARALDTLQGELGGRLAAAARCANSDPAACVQDALAAPEAPAASSDEVPAFGAWFAASDAGQTPDATAAALRVALPVCAPACEVEDLGTAAGLLVENGLVSAQGLSPIDDALRVALRDEAARRDQALGQMTGMLTAVRQDVAIVRQQVERLEFAAQTSATELRALRNLVGMLEGSPCGARVQQVIAARASLANALQLRRNAQAMQSSVADPVLERILPTSLPACAPCPDDSACLCDGDTLLARVTLDSLADLGRMPTLQLAPVEPYAACSFQLPDAEGARLSQLFERLAGAASAGLALQVHRLTGSADPRRIGRRDGCARAVQAQEGRPGTCATAAGAAGSSEPGDPLNDRLAALRGATVYALASQFRLLAPDACWTGQTRAALPGGSEDDPELRRVEIDLVAVTAGSDRLTLSWAECTRR